MTAPARSPARLALPAGRPHAADQGATLDAPGGPVPCPPGPAGRPTRAADQGATLEAQGPAPRPPGPAGRPTACNRYRSGPRRLRRFTVPAWACWLCRPCAAGREATLDAQGAVPCPPGPAGRLTSFSGPGSHPRSSWRGPVPAWPCRSADRVHRTMEPPSKHLARPCARLALSALQAACSGMGAALDAPGAALCPPRPAGRADRAQRIGSHP